MKVTKTEIIAEIINDAEKKQFSSFSKNVLTSLEDKLRNHPVIKAKAEELRLHQARKEAFATITKELGDLDNSNNSSNSDNSNNSSNL